MTNLTNANSNFSQFQERFYFFNFVRSDILEKSEPMYWKPFVLCLEKPTTVPPPQSQTITPVFFYTNCKILLDTD